MKELAAIVIELTNSKSEMVYEALPSDDPQQRKPDTTKASEILGWAAKVDLNAGLIKTIADFKPRVLAL
jgi:nucleoside-diphosphate-sugar epimerase